MDAVKPNKEVAVATLRALATESTDDEIRLQAASNLLHADVDYDPMPPVELLDEIAEKCAAKVVERLQGKPVAPKITT